MFELGDRYIQKSKYFTTEKTISHNRHSYKSSTNVKLVVVKQINFKRIIKSIRRRCYIIVKNNKLIVFFYRPLVLNEVVLLNFSSRNRLFQLIEIQKVLQMNIAISQWKLIH